MKTAPFKCAFHPSLVSDVAGLKHSHTVPEFPFPFVVVEPGYKVMPNYKDKISTALNAVPVSSIDIDEKFFEGYTHVNMSYFNVTPTSMIDSGEYSCYAKSVPPLKTSASLVVIGKRNFFDCFLVNAFFQQHFFPRAWET